MRECTLEELHGYLLDMLQFVDQICRENQITYFLSGGSAIGALRHQGFIPWDDDADLMMPRKDFEKFLRVTEKLTGRYRTGSLQGDDGWTFPYAKIWDTETRIEHNTLNESATGIFIDIFPMDGLPDSLTLTKLHYFHNKVCYILLHASMRKKFKPGEKYIPLKRVLDRICRKIGSGRICRHIDHAAAKRAFEASDYVGCTVLDHYMERERFPGADFREMRYVNFEKIQLPVPNGCEDYLTRLYGDYMKLPDRQESDHPIHVYI